LALALSALAATLAAQAPPLEPEAPKPLESWAAEARPVAVGRTPGQVRIFDEDDLQRSGARTLGEFLLRELPAQVQNQGGPGLPSRTFLGGSRPQDTVVLLDGVPLMDPGRLGQDLNEVPLLGLTRIEVITGSAGSGPSGQGGTIALFTGKPAKPGASGELSGLGGGNGQGQSTATPGYAWEGGFVRGGNLSAREEQTTETVRPFRLVTNFLSLGQQWGDARWTLHWRGTALGVPQPYETVTDFTRTYDAARESRQHSDAGQLRLDWELAQGLWVEASLGMARFRHEQPNEGSPIAAPFEGRQARFQTALHVITGARSTLSFRFEGQTTRQEGDADLLVLGAAQGQQVAAAVEWSFEPRPGFRLLGQLRGTRDRQALLLGAAETDVLNAMGHSFRLGFNQDLGHGLRLYGAGGSGRTAPTLLQQLRNAQVVAAPVMPLAPGDILVPKGEPLRMEQSTFLQVGLGWGQGNWYGKLESQQQTGRDLIGLTNLGYVNLDRVRVRGTEVAFGWRTANKTGLEAFARAQEARDLTAPEGQQFGTRAAQRRPFSSHGLKGFLGWGRVRTELHYTLQGRQYAAIGDGDVLFRGTAQGPAVIRPTQVVYRNVGLSTSVQVGRSWTFVLRGENLLQKKTTAGDWVADTQGRQNDGAIIDGFPAPRPSYGLEARVKF
jgi:hypothetical protein